MSFKVGGYSFTGRFAMDEINEIKDLPGLYAILCRRGKRHYLVDVGESNELRSELEKNGKKELWDQHCSGTLVVSIYYTDGLERSDRVEMERKIKRRHNPPCGKSWRIKL
jgi:hypothetical protein